ncbi:VOC family protein [Streptomyces sp. 110]|uniref:VOC family protein n=1 Tax=Streptomyces endocoffeicus TaxID=2898945 RepID=A0ABS1PF38_9ACTN|nr:VOC family protein [Streptomyces endocoffeicus]MBL1110978.1 VOC family protein [Streptomyces endocoffeicus]
MSEVSSVIGHIGLCVPRIEEAIDWYGKALGLQVISGPFEINADEDAAACDVFGPEFRSVRQAHMVGANGVGLELFEFITPAVDTSVPASYWRAGYSHLCFVVPDIEAAEERIRSLGGRIRTSRIWPLFRDQPYRFLHFEDPFGNLLELHSHGYERTFSNQQP